MKVRVYYCRKICWGRSAAGSRSDVNREEWRAQKGSGRRAAWERALKKKDDQSRRAGEKKSRNRSSRPPAPGKAAVTAVTLPDSREAANEARATVRVVAAATPKTIVPAAVSARKNVLALRPNALQPAMAPAPAAKTATKSSRKVAPGADKAAAEQVRVFQIFYEDWHKELLDPEFEPYDNRGVQSELHEFAVFEKLAESAEVAGAPLWGALSWRFSEKTGMSGKEWLEAVAARPGFDVYYCNPFPENEALYHNVWVQGEPSHPSFLELVTAVFNAAGLPHEELASIDISARFASANYFVATPAFWASYLRFVRLVLGKAERKMPARMRTLLHSRAADQNNFHFGATYVPFVVERLFTTFLTSEGASFKACKVPLPAREKQLNVHLRLLREMKDVAHKTNSKWMAACWVNYRNLYVNNTNGREWCQKYLRAITPTSVKFAGAKSAKETA
jgi:hypothetical protein